MPGSEARVRTIFITMDTTRADRLSCLGYPRATTPNLDRLASEGALFSRAFASDIPTQPSHTALFTGRAGARTGIVSHFWPPASLSEDVPWLPEIMRRSGRRTAAVDHLFVMKDWFIRGYDDYIVPEGRSRSPAADINALAFPWLDEHAHEDFFLFLHYWDAHIPYVPPPEFRDRFAADSMRNPDPDVWAKLKARPSYPLFQRTHYDHLKDPVVSLDYLADLYDAEIAYLDHHLGNLFGKLDELGILDETMIVVYGDHGEIMTEHDAWFDHAGLYDSVVHVPLIIRHPPTVAPARVDAIVQLMDVFPTVCETAGIQIPDGTMGRSLHPLIRGDAATHYEEILLSEATWQAKRAVRTDRWKYIRCYDPGVFPERNAPELYDLHADPAEQQNLAEELPAVARQMSERLDALLAHALAGAPDRLLEVLETELPAVARLQGVIDEIRASAGAG